MWKRSVELFRTTFGEDDGSTVGGSASPSQIKEASKKPTRLLNIDMAIVDHHIRPAPAMRVRGHRAMYLGMPLMGEPSHAKRDHDSCTDAGRGGNGGHDEQPKLG